MGWNEKWTLRFAVVALIFLAMTGFEGVLMRTHMAAPQALAGFERALNAIRITDHEPTEAELFYGMMTVHPIVGVYGFAYMAVMERLLLPGPLPAPEGDPPQETGPGQLLASRRGASCSAGSPASSPSSTLSTPSTGPSPSPLTGVPLVGTIPFTIGAAVIMVNILLFSFNTFSTVLSRSNPGSYTFGQFLRAALGIRACCASSARRTKRPFRWTTTACRSSSSPWRGGP